MKNGNSPAMPMALETRVDEFGAVDDSDAYEGMTKREMIAMHAMQGMLSNSDASYDFDGAATDAVKFAEALLKELEKQQ